MTQFLTRMWPTVLCTIFCMATMGDHVLANPSIVNSNGVNTNFVATNINWILDKFLTEYRKSTIRNDKSVMQLDDIKEEFTKVVFFVEVEGSFEAKEGSLKNLSTIYRTQDASLVESGGKVIMDVHLGLKDLEIYFNHYRITFFNIDETGTVKMGVGSNSVHLQLAITYNSECLVTLTELKFDELGDFNISLTGLSVLDSFADNISEWILNTFKNLYIPTLERSLFTEMSKAVADADICHYLPF